MVATKIQLSRLINKLTAEIEERGDADVIFNPSDVETREELTPLEPLWIIFDRGKDGWLSEDIYSDDWYADTGGGGT